MHHSEEEYKIHLNVFQNLTIDLLSVEQNQVHKLQNMQEPHFPYLPCLSSYNTLKLKPRQKFLST